MGLLICAFFHLKKLVFPGGVDLYLLKDLGCLCWSENWPFITVGHASPMEEPIPGGHLDKGRDHVVHCTAPSIGQPHAPLENSGPVTCGSL